MLSQESSKEKGLGEGKNTRLGKVNRGNLMVRLFIFIVYLFSLLILFVSFLFFIVLFDLRSVGSPWPKARLARKKWILWDHRSVMDGWGTFLWVGRYKI